jgi:hypothetical protein
MAEENQADDLRSLLSSSYDQAHTPAEERPEPKAVETKEPEAKAEPSKDDAKPSGDRARDASGKFVKAEGTEDKPAEEKSEKKETDEPKVVKSEPEKKDDEKPAAETKGGVEPPANWAASDKAMFKLQTSEAQAFLLRRHKQMEADHTRKTEEIAELRKEFGPVAEMFKPHLDVMKQKGLTPASTIRAWANVETALANGQGVNVIQNLVKGYNIPLDQVARALGFARDATAHVQPNPDAPTNGAHQTQPAQLPPELLAELRDLRAKVDAREANDRNFQSRTAQEREARVEADITKFKSATSSNGELMHPYFDEVEPAMIALAQSKAASRQPMPSIEELYETAVWANPSTRQAILAAERQKDEARRTEEARAKAASARKAGSSVTGAPGSGQATKPIRGEISLREQLEEAFGDTSA